MQKGKRVPTGEPRNYEIDEKPQGWHLKWDEENVICLLLLQEEGHFICAPEATNEIGRPQDYQLIRSAEEGGESPDTFCLHGIIVLRYARAVEEDYGLAAKNSSEILPKEQH